MHHLDQKTKWSLKQLLCISHQSSQFPVDVISSQSSLASRRQFIEHAISNAIDQLGDQSPDLPDADETRGSFLHTRIHQKSLDWTLHALHQSPRFLPTEQF